LAFSLIAQDYTQKATVNCQRAATGVIDKAQNSELVHEMTDPRAGGANHLRQLFLIDSGMDRFGSAFFPKMRQQEKNPVQALPAGVEKLVDEILFKASAASEMMSAKNPMFRERLKAT
jgi:hypothetical protein